MHIGGLRTALYAYLIAKHGGGEFLLRIEDTDQARFVEGATEKIYSSLKECGLKHDEGPDIGGKVGPYVQTERREIYREYAEKLIALGGAYRDGDVIRQRIPKEGTTVYSDLVFGDIIVPNDSASMDEGVLMKSDGLPTYNFANVVDDHLMGITHVVRGSEYLSSAPKYVLLYKAFGWEMPENISVSLIMRDATHKLSKREGDPTFDDLLNEGFLPEAILNYVALLGWSPKGEREFFTLEELVTAFEISGISKSPALFDKVKLRYFNAHYIRELPPEHFATLAKPYIENILGTEFDSAAIAALPQPRCEVLGDIDATQIGFFKALPTFDAELFTNKKNKLEVADSLAILNELLPILDALDDWDKLKDALTAFAEEREMKTGKLYWPLRIALSGQAVTPGGPIEIAAILGKAESLRRIELSIKQSESKI
jgi:glutamyl-tRNA synthetase